MTRRIPWLLAAITVSCMMALGAGCGSSGDTLGSNANVEASLRSNNIGDLEYVIAPLQGTFTDANACTETAGGSLNCTKDAPDSQTIRFKFITNSDASANPYYVHVKNNGLVQRSFNIDILMDGTRKLQRDLTIEPGQTLLVAKIFRNNADLP
jgi:hypothetical protein